ncbi:hypothetical protein D3C71_1959350 [compost metagenome]
MKKISLKDLMFTDGEPLSREQLKNVMGGAVGYNGVTTTKPVTTTVGGSGCSFTCNCPDGTSSTINCTGLTTAQAVAACASSCSAA